jgi:tetratricopeptide (TPR) repeat protein
MDDRLRGLWDFGDLAATEGRLREQLARETTDEGRAEVLTQLARVRGLHGDFEAGERLVDEAEAAADESNLALARVELERGRLRRSSGNIEAALPLFESAFARSLEAGHYFVAVDAAHMAALAAPDREGIVSWTERGVELAETHASARYWLGPLLNNLGWEYYEACDYELALDTFQRALAAREADPESRGPIEIARYAVGKTLRALGRSADAVPLLQQATSWAIESGSPDGWFHEELAEEYDAMGRHDEASEHARLALPLLLENDPSFTEDAERSARLHALAGLADPPESG